MNVSQTKNQQSYIGLFIHFKKYKKQVFKLNY